MGEAVLPNLRRGLVAMTLALFGCGEASKAPAPRAPAAASSPAVPAPESLIGEYRVAGIDGMHLDADFGIALSVERRRISFEPKCAGFVWDYTYSAGTLRTQRAPDYGPTRQPDGSVLACAVAVPREMQRLGQALDAARSVERTPANALEVSGGGRSVTLFSQ